MKEAIGNLINENMLGMITQDEYITKAIDIIQGQNYSMPKEEYLKRMVDLPPELRRGICLRFNWVENADSEESGKLRLLVEDYIKNDWETNWHERLPEAIKELGTVEECYWEYRIDEEKNFWLTMTQVKEELENCGFKRLGDVGKDYTKNNTSWTEQMVQKYDLTDKYSVGNFEEPRYVRLKMVFKKTSDQLDNRTKLQMYGLISLISESASQGWEPDVVWEGLEGGTILLASFMIGYGS